MVKPLSPTPDTICSMVDANMRDVTLLLGAGASVEAGVPATVGLTRTIAETVEQLGGRYEGTTQALNIAIGAMIAHDTASGGSPYDGIDVERLFSAIQMLGDRDRLEISPFVASWNAALDGLGQRGRLPAFYGRDFQKAVLSEHDSMRFERVFREGVEAVAGRRKADPVFQNLEKQMIAALQKAVHVDHVRVDYLTPLLNIGDEPLRIATLNYDRSVELLAQRAGLEIATGVSLWTGGFEWDWEAEADVRLLKLHGSIDWYLGQEGVGPERLAEEKIIVTEAWSAKDVVGGGLAVVFGQRGKLRSNGPFLAMLRGFDDFLSETRHLIVVGYSFRDEHINASIRRWFNHTEDPRVTLIDPALKDISWRNKAVAPFLRELLNAMTTRVAGPPLHNELLPQHKIIADTASNGLIARFGRANPLPPMSASESEPGQESHA